MRKNERWSRSVARPPLWLWLLGALMGLHLGPAQAQVAYGTAGSTYTQDFQSMTATALTPAAASATTMLEVSGQPGGGASTGGWYVYNQAGTARWGRNNGSVATGSMLGMFDSQTTPDRALGSLASASIVQFFGVALKNTTGTTLTSATITYDAVMNRNPTTTVNAFPMSYRISSTGVASGSSTTDGTFNDLAGTWTSSTGFSTPSSGTGAPNATQAAISPLFKIGGASITATLTGLTWAPNDVLYIRWKDTDESGNDATAGVDNFNFSAEAGVPGTLALSSNAYTKNESAGPVTITVNRTGGSGGAVSIDYATTDGSATQPGDYTQTTGTLNFAAGETSKTFDVPFVDDSSQEGDETFTVTLSNPTGGATLGAPASATVTIIDNDVAGTFVLSGTAYTANENAGTATITVNRTVGSSGTATIDYATSDGSAIQPGDYTTATGTLNFADGETTKTFDVPILDDAANEGSETVTLTLSNPTGGALTGSPSTATLTILDNDAPALALLNEIEVNTPTGSDVPYEYIELKGTPGAALSTLALIEVSGDSGFRGNVNISVDLSGATFGSNGLLLLAGSGGRTATDPNTNTLIVPELGIGTDALRNSTQSFLVVSGPAIAINTDVDTDDDGNLDLPGGVTALDAVGWSDGGAGDLVYGGVSLTQSSGTPDAATRFPNNNTTFSFAAWYNADLTGAVDSVSYDATKASANFPSGGGLTPGASNLPTAGTLQLSAATYSFNEGVGTATITVTRTGGSIGAVTVDYATTDGSATQPDDYTSTSGTLSFADGETSKDISLSIIDDGATEGDETLSIALSNVTGGATLGTPNTATVTITDNDVAGTFVLDQSAYTVSETAGTLTVTVNRTIGTTGTVTVDYATSDGSATQPGDYTETTGTLTFGPGEAGKTFTIPVINDSDVENAETLGVALSNPTGGALLGTPSTATVTINSEDTPAIVLNEIVVNTPGTDNPYEYVEIKGTPSATLPSGTYLVVYEGDTAATAPGTADMVVNLSGQTLGTNGLLVIKSPTGGHTIPAATTVLTDAQFDTANGGLENGTSSFALY